MAGWLHVSSVRWQGDRILRPGAVEGNFSRLIEIVSLHWTRRRQQRARCEAWLGNRLDLSWSPDGRYFAYMDGSSLTGSAQRSSGCSRGGRLGRMFSAITDGLLQRPPAPAGRRTGSGACTSCRIEEAASRSLCSNRSMDERAVLMDRTRARDVLGLGIRHARGCRRTGPSWPMSREGCSRISGECPSSLTANATWADARAVDVR